MAQISGELTLDTPGLARSLDIVDATIAFAYVNFSKIEPGDV